MKFLEHIIINPKIVLEKGKVYPFVEMANVSTSSRDPLIVEYKKYDSGVKFEIGDSVVARITPCLQNGKRFYCKNIKKGFGSSEYLVFRPKDKEINNRYLYYLLQTNDIKEKMIKSMLGASGRQRVNNDVFKHIDITLPTIETQHKIADILSSYDDLIENNQKQIKLLEEAAERLYKEWFLDLHFPNYENTPIIDGIPQGWEKKEISYFGEIITGKTPSTKKKEYYENGVIPFVKIPDMHNTIYPITTEVKLSKNGANSQKNKYISKDSLIVSCIATVGLVNIAYEECQTNQQINSLVLNDGKYLYYMFFTLKRLKDLLDGVGSSGATMTNVNKNKFASIKVLCANQKLIYDYFNFCKPIFDKIKENLEVIKDLQEARDRLLPKLMSGEIEV